MKFRITIMPTQKNNIKQTPANLFKDNGQSGIIISSEEISAVNFNVSDFTDGFVSNTESDITVRILGIILSHLDETENSQLGLKNLLSSYTTGKLNGLTGGLSQGMNYLGNIFSSNLNTTLLGMTTDLTQEVYNLSSLYSSNLKNTIELTKWALEYGEATDYRDVVIEIIINDSMSKTYILPDMYAVKYSESMAVSNGNGVYEILLKQKRYSNRKIKIK